MKAIVLRELGEPENLRLEEVSDPQPKEGEVVVRLRAAALNHRDVFIRRGLYPGINLPIILGSDGAGEVAVVGAGVDPQLVGQHVVINPGFDWGTDVNAQSSRFRILGLPDDGTYAQLVKVPLMNLSPKPAALSWEEAAALPLAALTAYRSVITRAQVRSGERVVVTGIGGGVATFAMQIANHLGAEVYVTSGSDEKLARARKFGAAGGVNYHSLGWSKELVNLIGSGPEVVIDATGGEVFNQALEMLRPGGRLVSYGATIGAADKVEIRRIFWKQLSVLGSTMGTKEEFTAMLRLYDESELRPIIDQVFELKDAALAHHRMEEAEQFGKIILRID